MHLKKLVEERMNIPCIRAFRYDTLPTIFGKILKVMD